MIYIVHGEDFPKSRNLVLNQQKKLGVETRVELELASTSPEELFSQIHSNNLFGSTVYVVLNISKSGRTNLEPYINKIVNVPENTVLIILADKTLSSTNAFIKNANKLNANKLNAKIIDNASTPLSNTFKFVDSVFFKRREEAYKELSKLIQDQVEPFEIFSMLQWGLRNVAQAKFDNQNFFRGRDFVKNKAISQAKLYTDDSVKNLYFFFSGIDKDSKTGGVEPSMMIPLVVEKVLNS